MGWTCLSVRFYMVQFSLLQLVAQQYCYLLEWSLLSDAAMQTGGLSATPHNNANTLVYISLVTLAAVHHCYVRDNVHVEGRFL
jgi:hypothetical protein